MQHVLPPPPPPGPRPATARPAPARRVEPFNSMTQSELRSAAANFLVAIGFGEYAQPCLEAEVDLFALSGMTVAELQEQLGVQPSKLAYALQDETFKLKRCLHRSSNAVELPAWIPPLLTAPAPQASPPEDEPGPPPGFQAGKRGGITSRPASARPMSARPASARPTTTARPASARGGG